MDKHASIIRKAALVCFFAASFAGCATTQQANSAEMSGFLKNYSQLKPGNGDQAILSYRNPSAQWSKYKKLMIDPVAIFGTKNADMKSDSYQERKALANYFNSVLNENLKKNFFLVQRPGEGVLRLRVALTDADQSEVLLDTVTTLMPIGLAVSTLKRAATGSDTAVGFAQAEMEVTDSQTTERLAAAVDKRYGTKALRTKFDSWNHAREAMDYWAEQIAAKLVEAGAGRPSN